MIDQRRAITIWSRLSRLPAVCEAIILDPREHADERAEIAMRGLPYASVMALALVDPSVRWVLSLLPTDFRGWAPR